MQEKAAAKLVFAVACALVVTAVVIPATGIRPYGERDLLAQIEREDQALCAKWGAIADDCMRDLADLRERHVDLLRSHSWL